MLKQETAGSINGVPGRFFNVIELNGKIVNQKWVSESRPVSGYGAGGRMKVKIRHDDECRNGHETFSITAYVTTDASRKQNDIEAGGCMHEEIARVFPELAHLIKWHLVSTDGPMHYIANTTYHAGDRDHNGLLKGEKRQIRNGKTGKLAWRLMAIDNEGVEHEIHTLDKYSDSDSKPACQYRLEYRAWCTIGEGKERQFDYARASAVWSEATEEQLSLPKEQLAELLKARLPGLLAQFKADIESCGLIFSVQ